MEKREADRLNGELSSIDRTLKKIEGHLGRMAKPPQDATVLFADNEPYAYVGPAVEASLMLEGRKVGHITITADSKFEGEFVSSVFVSDWLDFARNDLLHGFTLTPVPKAGVPGTNPGAHIERPKES